MALPCRSCPAHLIPPDLHEDVCVRAGPPYVTGVDDELIVEQAALLAGHAPGKERLRTQGDVGRRRVNIGSSLSRDHHGWMPGMRMGPHLLERHGLLGVEPLSAGEDCRHRPRRVKHLDLIQVPGGSETTAVAGDLRGCVHRGGGGYAIRVTYAYGCSMAPSCRLLSSIDESPPGDDPSPRHG